MKRVGRGNRTRRLPRSRYLLLWTLVLGAIACGSAGSSARRTHTTPASSKTPWAALTIRYWPHGQGNGGERLWTLTCRPTGGNHPAAAKACAELTVDKAPFASPTTICPMVVIFGSPQAEVSGRLDAQPVHAVIRVRCGTQWPHLHVLLTGR